MSFKPGYRRKLPTLEEHVREVLEKWRPRFNAAANHSVIVYEAKKRGTEQTGQAISALIDELFRGNKIVYAPKVHGALDEAKNLGTNNHYDFRSVASEKRVLDKAEELGFDISNTVDLNDVMAWLIWQNEIPLSALGQERQYEEQREKQRVDLIARITRGRDAFPLPQSAQKAFLGVDHGRAINIDSSRIQGESLERLKKLEGQVGEYRKVRDVDLVARSSGPDDEGIVMAVPAQTPIQEAEDEFLLNESTGKEFTARELKRLSPQQWRDLLFINGQSRGKARVNAINRILRGERFQGTR